MPHTSTSAMPAGQLPPAALARQLDRDFHALCELFEQLCQQASVLAESHSFFAWPAYEESAPLKREFTLLGEERCLRLRSHLGEDGRLYGSVHIYADDAWSLAKLSFLPNGEVCGQGGRLLANAPQHLLALLLHAAKAPVDPVL
ncbi:MAG: hypothetical protein ACRCYV_10165 [Aeromonas sp.]